MSEYQYYEFRALDRPLTSAQRDELRKVSTRAEITSTSFTNTYHYGNFKGNRDVLMDRYFDAFVYVSNWGTRRLLLRLPSGLLNERDVSPYCDDESLTVRATDTHLILGFSLEEEPGYDEHDGEGWMSSLLDLRDELSRGDLRPLYLGWLASLDTHPEEGLREPPVPPGLAKLSPSQEALAQFLKIDDALVEAAALGSEDNAPAGPSADAIATWVKTLPAAEVASSLARLLSGGDDLGLRGEMLARFRKATAKPARVSAARRRTVGELQGHRDRLLQARNFEAALREAEAQKRREQKAAQEHARRLDDLASREPRAWDEVERLIALKTAKGYDQAIALLVDLRDVARRDLREDWTLARIGELRLRHSAKPSLIARLREHGLAT